MAVRHKGTRQSLVMVQLAMPALRSLRIAMIMRVSLCVATKQQQYDKQQAGDNSTCYQGAEHNAKDISLQRQKKQFHDFPQLQHQLRLPVP